MGKLVVCKTSTHPLNKRARALLISLKTMVAISAPLEAARLPKKETELLLTKRLFSILN